MSIRMSASELFPGCATGSLSPGYLQICHTTGVDFVTRFPRAARIVSLAVVCSLSLVIIAALWAPRRSGETGPVKEPAQKQSDSSGEHFAVLTWKASPSVVAGYNVYRADDPGGPYKKLNSSPVRETSYKDSAVQPGHQYFYRVTSIDAKGRESRFSSHVRATVPSS